MARFLKHIGCDKCGSSDAKAIYSDNSTYCFSCRKPTGSKVSPYAILHTEKQEDAQKVSLPTDATNTYSLEAVAWAAKYEITVPQLLQEGVVYSEYRKQLIFTWHDDSNKLLAYQARNLNAVSKSKRYFTCGDVNELLPIYVCRFPLSGSGAGRRLVLVEDCLSAIKISHTRGLGASAMPLLGSGINLRKLSRLRPFYDVLTVFLDGDMYPKALQIMRQAQMLGFKTKVVYSELDPKAHSYKDLTEMLA